jgi:hypothetical protein
MLIEDEPLQVANHGLLAGVTFVCLFAATFATDLQNVQVSIAAAMYWQTGLKQKWTDGAA